jgi:hypothetical protein
MIAGELAALLGHDTGFTSVEEIWAEIESVSPLHAGVRDVLLGSRAGRDGVVVGVASADGAAASGADELAELRPLDPMADPGIASAEIHEIPAESLSATWVSSTVGAPVGAEGAPPRLVLASAPAAPPRRRTRARKGETAADAAARAVAAASAPAWNPPPAGTLRLVAVRTMWDGGTALTHSPSLADLAPAPVVGLHPSDLAAHGLSAGDAVVVVSAQGTLPALPVVADAGLAPGSVAVGCNLAGASATALIDPAAAVTDVELGREGGGGA